MFCDSAPPSRTLSLPPVSHDLDLVRTAELASCSSAAVEAAGHGVTRRKQPRVGPLCEERQVPVVTSPPFALPRRGGSENDSAAAGIPGVRARCCRHGHDRLATRVLTIGDARRCETGGGWRKRVKGEGGMIRGERATSTSDAHGRDTTGTDQPRSLCSVQCRATRRNHPGTVANRGGGRLPTHVPGMGRKTEAHASGLGTQGRRGPE